MHFILWPHWLVSYCEENLCVILCALSFQYQIIAATSVNLDITVIFLLDTYLPAYNSIINVGYWNETIFTLMYSLNICYSHTCTVPGPFWQNFGLHVVLLVRLLIHWVLRRRRCWAALLSNCYVLFNCATLWSTGHCSGMRVSATLGGCVESRCWSKVDQWY